MPEWSRTERSAVAELLGEVGPEAPTLCAGWQARDLAAHLVGRDRRLRTLAGLLVRPLRGLAERDLAAVRDQHSYAELVDLVRAGAPPWSPTGFPLTESGVNTVEFFVHHEDVRRARAGWEPRVLGADFQDAMWRRLRAWGRYLFRNAPCGIVLRRPDGQDARVRGGGQAVEVCGLPSELTIFATGRQEHARVELAGDDDLVAALRSTSLAM